MTDQTSRSISRLVVPIEGERERAKRVCAYEEGYRRQPETATEVKAAMATAAELLSREPWK